MIYIIVAFHNFGNAPKITIFNKFILFHAQRMRENNRTNGALDGGALNYSEFVLLTGVLGIIRRYGDRRKGGSGRAVLYPEGLWWDAIVDREDSD